MKLIMKAVGWSSDGPSNLKQENVTQYKVEVRGNDDVFIRATTTAQEGTTWMISRNGQSSGKFATAEAALEALEIETELHER